MSTLQGAGEYIFGPTLLDLQLTARTNMETISFVFTAWSIGRVLGAIVNGFIVKHFNPWMILVATSILGCLGMAAVPFCRQAGVLFFVAAVYGFTTGFYNVGMYCFVSIWQNMEKNVMNVCIL